MAQMNERAPVAGNEVGRLKKVVLHGINLGIEFDLLPNSGSTLRQ